MCNTSATLLFVQLRHYKKVGEYRMTFVTVCADRAQLTSLCHMLVTLFPGCTIHQNRNPVRAMRQLSDEKVDAVFVDADTYSGSMDILCKQNLRLCLLCGKDTAMPEETKGFEGVLSYPITEQSVRATVQCLSRKTGRCDEIIVGNTYG